MSGARVLRSIIISLLLAVGLLVPAGLGSTAQAVDTATITGTVTDPDATGVADASVYLYQWDTGFSGWSYWSDGVTDTDGGYSFTDLPAGDYYVEVYTVDFEIGYSGGATDPPSTPTDPGAFSVADASSSVVDIALRYFPGVGSGSLGGTVADAGGPLEGAQVTVYRWDSPPDSGWVWAGDAPTAADGTWAVDRLPAGDYLVEFYADSHAIRYANDATAYPDQPGDPGTLTLADGQHRTAVDALLPLDLPDGWLSGTVTDQEGNPLDDIEVSAYPAGSPAGGTPVGTTQTWGGTFEDFYLEPGDYRLEFDDQGSSWASATRGPVTVNEDAGTVVAPVQLAPAPTGTASGHVAGPAGEVAGAYVTLYRMLGTPGADDYRANYIDSIDVDPSGNYSFSGVAIGRRFTVSATGTGASYFLGNVLDERDADTFTGAASTSLSDITLPAPAIVSGTVSYAGAPVPGVSVDLYLWDEFDETFQLEKGTSTDAGGDYAMTVPRDGRYTLRFVPGEGSDGGVTWLNGTSQRPVGPNAAGTFAYPGVGGTVDQDVTLVPAVIAAGTVSAGGAPAADTRVTRYVWTGDGWTDDGSVTSAANGSYRSPVPENSTVTFGFSKRGWRTTFLGGGATLPAAPATGNHVVVGTSNVTVPQVALLALPPSTLGKVAGENHSWCRTNALPGNDDSSSQAVDIPFPLTYFGEPHTQLYVNNNGNVTFDAPQSTYTPTDLTGAGGRPMIAPFFADIDTSSFDSRVVTYGASPDGNQFCVNWADVGYYSEHTDKLNTVQLILTRNDTGAGRGAGDFDMTFNYDQVEWETGDASGGSNGLGGTSAAVGFTGGTGVPGTFIQLAGSFVNGALLDGGPNALVAGSQNSTQPGRYVFEVRNSGIVVSLGNLAGRVLRDSNSAPVVGARVQACLADFARCYYGTTSDTGGYSFAGVRSGSYNISVWPEESGLFSGGTTATVTTGGSTTAPVIRLRAPVPMPANVEINGNPADGGVPSVYYNDPITLDVVGCSGVANPTVTRTLGNGTVLPSVPMTVSAGPGGLSTYHVVLPAFYPNTGNATIATNVPATCGGPNTSFNIYIDPSGVVTDQYGRPIQNATVTLLRADSDAGPFEVVPDGSDIMSPSNRTNPDLTDATGFFRWDVVPGFYKVAVTKAGCTPVTTDAMEVPPERIDLLIKMTCTAPMPTPTSAPAITGTRRAGEALTAVPGTWADPLAHREFQWLNNGTPIPGATGSTYVPTAVDVGDAISVVDTAFRAPYTTEGGTGSTVEFAPATATSSAVTVLTGAAATNSSAPTITGTAKVGQTLTAAPGTWNPATGLTFSYQWLRAGAPISGATSPTYALAVADAAKAISVEVSAARAGHATGTATSAAKTVPKISSKTTAKLVKAKIAAGKRGKVTFTVKAPGIARPTGKISVVVDGKVKLKVTLKAKHKGKVTVTLPRLKKGKHKISGTYAGTATINRSTSRKVTLTVTR